MRRIYYTSKLENEVKTGVMGVSTRKPLMKKALVEVTFLQEINDLKIFRKVPGIFLNPLKVSRIRKIERKELHER